MNVTDKKILQGYSGLYEGLSFNNKCELIAKLTRSLKSNKSKKDNFYKSFGAFASEKSEEELISEIKSSGKF